MKKPLIAMVAFLVSLPLGLLAQSDQGSTTYNALSYARLSFVNGDVFVQRTSDLGYEKGEVNLALVQGDKLGTGSGQAEVNFGRKNFLRLGENTKVEFATLPKDGNDRAAIHILNGTVFLRVSALPSEKGFEVDTPDASYYVLEEGLYRFNVEGDKQSEVFVREGSLEAAGQEGSVVVRRGETVAAADGKILGSPSDAMGAEDEFDRWNGSRDSLLPPKTTTRYMPTDLDEYENDLDQNGHWVYEQPYGNVWVPYVYNEDWRPYLYGRWLWYNDCGWTWISSESWGWPVYHYGRWGWRMGLGWYWIPHTLWGPAWVNWWWDNDYCGWSPLSWYNRPIVLWNNAFYDRYRDGFFPLHNRAMTVIRRNQLQERGIDRHFLRGNELDHLGRISLQARQPSIRPVVDRTGPQTLQAQRVFSRNGSPGGDRAITSRPSLVRPGIRQDEGRTTMKGALSGPARDTSNRIARDVQSRPSSGGAASTERAIRSYPSNRSGGAVQPGRSSSDAGTRLSDPSRTGGAGTRDSQPRVYPSRTNTPATGRSDSQRSGNTQPNRGSGTSGKTTRTGEKIKNYPSRSNESASALNPRSSSLSSQLQPRSFQSTRSYPSRVDGSTSRSLTAPRSSSSRSTYQNSTPGRSSSSYSNSSRSYQTPNRSYSYSAPSRSYSAPSRSYSSPSRPSNSYQAPRSGSSSYSRSSAPRYSAPSRSSGSYSSPRSSGSSSHSSSSRSSSSSHSSSSSSHSSSGHSSSSHKH